MTFRDSNKQDLQTVQIEDGQLLLTHDLFKDCRPVPRKIGYARVSTEEQNLDMQVAMLEKAGVHTGDLFADKISAKAAKRPHFHLMMKHLQRGDTLVVYAVSRLFRDVQKLLTLLSQLKRMGVELVSLTENLDLKTSHGRFIATVLAAADQHERERISDRTAHGMAELKRQGMMLGRPVKVSPDIAKQMKAMRKSGVKPPVIAARFKVSAAAVYQHTK